MSIIIISGIKSFFFFLCSFCLIPGRLDHQEGFQDVVKALIFGKQSEAWHKRGLAWNSFLLLPCGNRDGLSRGMLRRGRRMSAVSISRELHGYSSVLLGTDL